MPQADELIAAFSRMDSMWAPHLGEREPISFPSLEGRGLRGG